MVTRKVWESGQPVKRNLMRRDHEYTIHMRDGSIRFGELLSKWATMTPRAGAIFYTTDGIFSVKFANIESIWQNKEVS